MKYNGLQVNLEPILREMGIIGHKGGVEINTHCPIHEDRSPSFSINMDTGLWICFSGCGRGNIFDLARLVGYPRMRLQERLLSGDLPIDPQELLTELYSAKDAAIPAAAYYVPPIVIKSRAVKRITRMFRLSVIHWSRILSFLPVKPWWGPSASKPAA